MRFGIVILPDQPWQQAASLWRGAEELGFDHAWTYDHLVWSGLPDSPWFAAVPVLTAAASVTERIRLGTLVSSPNNHHPYQFLRELLALDDISGGRVICGLGTGGDLDARILGGEDLTLKERVDRFHEFVPALDRLMREDRVDLDGRWFRTVEARTLPGPAQPRVPLVIGANGPRSQRLAAAYGDGWVTYGSGGDTFEDWWAGVATLSERLTAAESEVGRTRPLDRYLSLDGGPVYSLESVGRFEEMVGRATELGFTDLVAHWPRAEGPYAGSTEVLQEAAERVLWAH